MSSPPARWMIMKPPPPMLPARGYVTAMAKPTATAASTALPPFCRTSAPMRAASASCATTMPSLATTAWAWPTSASEPPLPSASSANARTPGAAIARKVRSIRRRGGATALGDKDIAARLVVVGRIDRVHRVEQLGRFHPDRRIFVARDVEDEEAIRFGVVGRERRDMASALLADHLAQKIHEDEVILCGEIVAPGGTEGIETGVGGVMDLDGHRMEREKRADLIERHALPGEHRARQDRFGLLVENVVLRKDAVGLIFRARRSRHARCVENHDDARHAAIGLRLLGHEIVGDREIGRGRAALEKEPLALLGAEVGQIAGQRQRLGARSGGDETECECEQSHRAD